MKPGILSMHARILAKFNTTQIQTLERLDLVTALLDDHTHSDNVRRELIKRETLLNDILNSPKKQLYLLKTEILLERYKILLETPMSAENRTELQTEKNALIYKFLTIVKNVVHEQEWHDVNINVSFDDESTGTLCESCTNNDPTKFEIDYNNRKVCLECSVEQNTFETGFTFKDYNRVNLVGKFVYNRVLHFHDCINQYQGKQNSTIPVKLYKDLDEKFNSYRLLVVSDVNSIKYSKITKDHILMFLKDLKYSKHYENVNLIYHTLTSKQPDNIDYLEHKLIDDFKTLANLYDSVHGKDKEQELDRKNFMNGQYILFQLLKRHGHPCNIDHFTVLKTIDRKLFHDKICSQLFEKLGWNFTPTF